VACRHSAALERDEEEKDGKGKSRAEIGNLFMSQHMISIAKSTILIVEDDTDNLDVLTQILEPEGYELELSQEPLHALRLLERVQPDLFLLDVMLPQMNGFHLLRQIRKMPHMRDVPAIFQSALGDQPSVVEGLDAGAFDYITKPLREDETRKRVRIQLENYHAKRLLEEQQQQLHAQLRWFRHSIQRAGLTAIRLCVRTKILEIQPALENPEQPTTQVSLLGFLRQMQQLLNEEDYAELYRLLERCVKERCGGSMVFRMRGENLSWQELSLDYVPEEKALLGSMLNVTSYHHISDRLRHQLQQAEARQQQAEDIAAQSAKLASLGEVAASIAHELKSPLAAMSLKTQMMQQYLEMHPDQDTGPIPRKLDDLLVINEKVTSLIQQVQNFARNEQQAERKPCSISQVLQGVLMLSQHALEQQGIRLSIEVPDGLPNVLGNQNQLEQVFINLLNNARDALAKREEKRITIRAEHADTTIVLSVTDTGCGMPAEVRDRLFESFFTTKERGKGTGLGMSIVRRLIEEHNGTIHVASEEGVGTTFTLRLPVTV
jgi:C4-dicarboxylate-specific signal transduction histidine kinase